MDMLCKEETKNMSMRKDGQAKCDKCGKLDGDKNPQNNELVEGWKRTKPNEHFCPDCKKETIPRRDHENFIPMKMQFSGWFFLRAVAEKVGKTSLKDVTAKDIHNFAHLDNTIFNKEHPKGDRIPPLFYEQVSLELAKEIVDNPDRTWEGK